MLPFITRLLRRAAKVPEELTGFLRRDLSSILSLADPNAPLGEKISWLEDLMEWMRRSSESSDSKHSQHTRLRFFLQTLDRNPIWKEKVAATIASLLTETDPLALFCETGLSVGEGIFSEAFERLLRKFLPTPRNDRNLAELFHRVFLDASDAEWIEQLGASEWSELTALIASDKKNIAQAKEIYQRTLSDALVFLASQVEAIGLSPEIRTRSHKGSIRESDFYLLRELASETIFSGNNAAKIKNQIQQCRGEIIECQQHIEEHGVSVAIVYRLELMERMLDRMEIIAAILFDGENQLWPKFISELVNATHERKRLSGLFRDNMHLLARKIVERTGASGEAYITTTSREYFQMLLSGAGGGFITAGTAAMKGVFARLTLAPFFDGLFNWINYSGSFILMQAFHFTLATKQPSMTAPILAARIKAAKTGRDFSAFAIEVAQISRSQFASALGNVGIVIPVAFFSDLLFHFASGKHVFPTAYGEKIIHSLNPFTTLTIPHAALTGVCLWLSSVAAGWAENWFVYRRLPDAIAQSALVDRTVGKKRSVKFAQWISSNISGIAGNIALGFFLSFTSVFGKFFGLPLAVPHVTLSSGALTYAWLAQPHGSVSGTEYFSACLGIVFIGALNFGVSFVAALVVAVRAASIRKNKFSLVLSAIGQSFRAQPLRFFFPPKSRKSH